MFQWKHQAVKCLAPWWSTMTSWGSLQWPMRPRTAIILLQGGWEHFYRHADRRRHHWWPRYSFISSHSDFREVQLRWPQEAHLPEWGSALYRFWDRKSICILKCRIKSKECNILLISTMSHLICIQLKAHIHTFPLSIGLRTLFQ